MHLKSIPCSKSCYWQHEWLPLISSCSDPPVSNIFYGASNVLANWLHEAAKFPLSGCLHEKENLFPAAPALSSLRERERGLREAECSWSGLKEFKRSSFFLYRLCLLFDLPMSKFGPCRQLKTCRSLISSKRGKQNYLRVNGG